MASNVNSAAPSVSDTLWSRALASIRNDLKSENSICLARAKHVELLSDVLQIAKEKRDPVST